MQKERQCDECGETILLSERQIAVLDIIGNGATMLHFHHYQGKACYTAFFLKRKEAKREIPFPEYEAT